MLLRSSQTSWEVPSSAPHKAGMSCYNPDWWHTGQRGDFLLFHIPPLLCLAVLFSRPVMSDSFWPTDCSMPGLPVPHHLLKFTQVHIHCISDAIQPSHPLMPSSPSVLNLSQHQGLFRWVSCSHQVTRKLVLQHQSFQWVFRVDFP